MKPPLQSQKKPKTSQSAQLEVKKVNVLLQRSSEVMTSCPVTIKKDDIRGRKLIFQTTDCQGLSLPSPPHPAACQSSCATCSSRFGCQSCGSRQPLLDPDSSQCLASCPAGSYQADHTHCRRECHHTPCAAYICVSSNVCLRWSFEDLHQNFRW